MTVFPDVESRLVGFVILVWYCVSLVYLDLWYPRGRSVAAGSVVLVSCNLLVAAAYPPHR
eukprot:1220282-Prorocentrum_lima.AAC.1